MNTKDRQLIRDYIAYDGGTVSLKSLECFVGMLGTGEFTIADFAAEGVDLESVARRYGSPNCWTGTSGAQAARLLEFIKSHKQGAPSC